MFLDHQPLLEGSATHRKGGRFKCCYPLWCLSLACWSSFSCFMANDLPSRLQSTCHRSAVRLAATVQITNKAARQPRLAVFLFLEASHAKSVYYAGLIGR